LKTITINEHYISTAISLLLYFLFIIIIVANQYIYIYTQIRETFIRLHLPMSDSFLEALKSIDIWISGSLLRSCDAFSQHYYIFMWRKKKDLSRYNRPP